MEIEERTQVEVGHRIQCLFGCVMMKLPTKRHNMDNNASGY